MKKTNTVFKLLKNYKAEISQYLCIDFLLKIHQYSYIFFCNDFWSLYFSTKNSKVPWKRVKRILLKKSEEENFKDNRADYTNESKTNIFLNNYINIYNFYIYFFIPIFRVNIPLDYKINDNKLILDAKNLNTKKDLFVKFEENGNVTFTINHNSSNFKIDKSNIYNEQIN
ncbi:MAG: hypothetical protein LBI80_00945 [Endomicrobium sp.]|jgi:hypothetical protein|nr:hypothetical protein [Endomicrobium sp.]